MRPARRRRGRPSAIAPCRRGAARRRRARRASPASSRATRTRARALLGGETSLPARRPVRPADPGAAGPRASSSTSRPASGSSGRSSSAGGPARPVARSCADGHRARRGRRGDRRRGARGGGRRRRTGPVPSRSSPGTLEVHLRPDADARGRLDPGARRPATVAFQHRQADIGEGATLHWALAQLGVAPRPQPGRQPPRGRSQLGRAGRDRVRRGRPAVRPDLVHPPHRPRHDRQPAVEGRPARRARSFMKGMIVIESIGGRDRQLPRRVRDEPLEGGPRRRDPVARDRPARLPPRGPSPARSARSTRPSCSTSRAAGSRPTRRASSSSSASSSRSSRASRSVAPRTACASCSRRSGTPGAAAPEPAATRRRDETDRPPRRSTRSPTAR